MSAKPSAPAPLDAPPTGPVAATPENADRLVDRYRTMVRIRRFEEAVGRRFREGDVHGFVHTSIGQEAVAAGVCGLLRADDYLTTTHRGHGHCLAKGADPGAMMAELFGRQTGSCRGRGGSMHLAQPELGVLGANGVVGAGIPIAVGGALAAQVAEAGQVTVAFFGEGAVHCGAFHEGLVLAVGWRLPVVFACENNRYAEFTASDAAWGGPSLPARAGSYGMPAVSVDGNDVLAVEQAVAPLIAAAREGQGPSFVELSTYRIGGHYEGDAVPYRDPAEAERWTDADPLKRSRAGLAALERSDELDAIEQAADDEIRAAVEAALAAPYPDPASVLEDIRA